MKNAIVTGGTRGIGRGVSEMLLRRGYRVLATYARDEQAAEAFRAGLPPQYAANLLLMQADQSRRPETYRLIERIKSEFTSVHCVVCNAGLTVRKSFADTCDDDWDAMMEVAVNSHYILLRELRPLMPDDSRIIFTGSMMGIKSEATVLGYGVSKAAVYALARNLVKEYAGTGTTVNVVAPGFVETEWQKNKPQEIRQNICRKTAANRFAAIDEIVGAYAFCLDNAFVNGSVIEVSGGYAFR